MSKTALVHEWFTAMAGSEKVVEQLCDLYPQSDMFAVYADPDMVAGAEFLRSHKLQTSFIQNLPCSARLFRQYLLLMPLAVEQFDMSSYDVVISSNHAVAKGVLTGPDQLHISYVHTPIRYAWDLQHQYLREAGLDAGVKGWMTKWMLHKMRIWDYRTASGVDYFVANSNFIARRIRKVYGRRADVIYPPVDVSGFSIGERRDDFYLAASRLVPYKRMDLIVEAFTAMPDKKLVVVGDGPELEALRDQLPDAAFLGAKYGEDLSKAYASLDVFVHTGPHETFCQAVQEAMASGLPVLAPDAGGPKDLVLPGRTGYLLPADRERFGPALVEKVDALRDAALRARLGEKARKVVLGRTWPAVCHELVGHYEAVRGRAARAA